MESLLKDVHPYGFGIFGDGATITRLPMMKILASSTNNPNCVLDVIKCHKHMMQGGKKDAWYNPINILPIIKKIDPRKDRINVVAFDGSMDLLMSKNS
jgi:hypothetical protein